VAGKVRGQRFAIEKAIELHEQALSLARSDHERAQSQEDLGDDHAAAFHGDEAVSAYLGALTMLRLDATASSARARLCKKALRMSAEKWGTFRVQPDPSALEELVKEGLAAAQDDEDRAWLLALSGKLAIVWRGMAGADPIPLQERIAAVREGLALAESLDRPDLQMFATTALSELYEVAGSYELSVETAKRQLRLLDRVDSVTDRALCTFGVSSVLCDLAGEYEAAVELARESYTLARQLSPHERMHGLYGQIKPLHHLGRWTEVLTLLEEHLQYYRSEADVSCFAVKGGPMFGALTLARMGEVQRALQMGEMVRSSQGAARHPEALRAWLAVAVGELDRSRTIASEVLASGEAARRAPEAALAMLEVLAALEDWEALGALVTSVRGFVGAHALLGPACDRAEGLVRAAEGNREAALGSLHRSLEAFERLGARYEAARTKEAMASISSTENRREFLIDALRCYQEIGARPDADRVGVRLTVSG